ncbi:MAG: TIGR00266 family protein [Synergistaceae bacterium]|jgi:uncharacterized protein (TIGR00266 family)|nr:TIGR00266 family protein [Synergistaceae bacterium]
MEYKIAGSPLPVAICSLNKGEAVFTEKGGMSWMTEGFDMSTNMDGGLFSGLTRKMSGESFFMTTYTAKASGEIAFASEYPGEIKALNLRDGESVICQKDAFMAAERSVTLAAHFKKKIGFGFFGGEGFVMQKLTGPGTAFVELDGTVVEYGLKPGQKMLIDTGSLAMCEPTVDLDIQMVKGFKNILFGGEGLFLTTATGPGKIWLQSMSVAGLANKILALVPGK